MAAKICKIIICLLVLIPLIVSADETIVDEKKVKLTEKTETVNIVERDEIQRIANKTDQNISQLKGRISGLENEIRKLKSEINSLRHRLGVTEDSLGI